MKAEHNRFMGIALKEASKNLVSVQGFPFGACIVRNGKVVCVARNTVLKNKDATCHAEINAIRAASKKLKRRHLWDCVIYSTAEPCPMCFAAIHWARIQKIVLGATIRDSEKAGFDELLVSDRRLNRAARKKIRIVSGVMAKECKALLEEWTEKKKPVY